MRYEQLKPGDIFADSLGVYIKDEIVHEWAEQYLESWWEEE